MVNVNSFVIATASLLVATTALAIPVDHDARSLESRSPLPKRVLPKPNPRAAPAGRKPKPKPKGPPGGRNLKPKPKTKPTPATGRKPPPKKPNPFGRLEDAKGRDRQHINNINTVENERLVNQGQRNTLDGRKRNYQNDINAINDVEGMLRPPKKSKRELEGEFEERGFDDYELESLD